MFYNAYAILYSRGNLKCLEIIKNVFEKHKARLLYQADFFDFVSNVANTLPDFILVDGETLNVQNFPYHLLNNEIFKEKTKIIILSDTFKCENPYINVISIKKFPLYMEEYFSKKLSLPLYNIQQDCSMMINNLLIEIGFKPNFYGEKYLVEAVNLLLNNRFEAKDLTSFCYFIIANKNRTNIVNVEKNIRTSITRAYNNRSPKKWETVFNTKFKKVPSNKYFIFLCADKILEKHF